jgi:hypothetical protein
MAKRAASMAFVRDMEAPIAEAVGAFLLVIAEGEAA